jgi:hypothetical protein
MKLSDMQQAILDMDLDDKMVMYTGRGNAMLRTIIEGRSLHKALSAGKICIAIGPDEKKTKSMRETWKARCDWVDTGEIKRFPWDGDTFPFDDSEEPQTRYFELMLKADTGEKPEQSK